jgi:hypothetical protein
MAGINLHVLYHLPLPLFYHLNQNDFL